MLDFHLMERAALPLSDFDPDYANQAERHSFLKQLHYLISRPVIPGNESEYVITQNMAEYLAHVHDQPFDGILFSSVQYKGGTNVVLFPHDASSFSVEYVEQS